ncbi:hypothetical protein J2W27_004411 [Variovorax boronicumulans]|nr:hypothetical protein [Variovorax boronicumulans]
MSLCDACVNNAILNTIKFAFAIAAHTDNATFTYEHGVLEQHI